jgi:hypothetical protein
MDIIYHKSARKIFFLTNWDKRAQLNVEMTEDLEISYGDHGKFLAL